MKQFAFILAKNDVVSPFFILFSYLFFFQLISFLLLRKLQAIFFPSKNDFINIVIACESSYAAIFYVTTSVYYNFRK